MVDMHTIGAGGGSLAWVDAGGMLQVGPASAGADPGPACYARGGTEVTVTDANLILGRLRSGAFLGGRMQLDLQAAEQAMGRLAQQLGCSLLQAAEGVIRVANEHMARALRVISIERGVDPRGFTLVSFGGAGGLHVCALARALGLSQALVPVNAGVLSALGMLATPPGRQLLCAKLGLLRDWDDSDVDAELTKLAEEGIAALMWEGIEREAIEQSCSLDLRYLGQSYTLNVPWRDRNQAERDFHDLHQARYGHRMQAAVELVNLRVAVRGTQLEMELPICDTEASGEAMEWLDLPGISLPVPRYERASLLSGQILHGPVLLTEMASTLWVEPDWLCRVDPSGNLLLQHIE
jgi:N-methylhydantoinase A